MKNRIKKKLIALGYRMGQPLLIAAANLSRRGAYNSSVGAQIVLTATIERIRSNDVSDYPSLTDQKRTSLMSMSLRSALEERASFLLD